MDLYTVYMHRNKINGKIYIGQTCQKPERRWREGKGYLHSSYFYNAITKYGWDNFEHIILKSNLTREESNQYEQALIKRYDSTNPLKGYNLADGGSNHLRISTYKPIIQYSFSGEQIAEYKSLKQAAIITGINAVNISAAARQKYAQSGGYLWRFKGDDLTKEEAIIIVSDIENRKINRLQALKTSNCRPVTMISLETKKILKNFPSAVDASKELNLNVTAIYDDCKKKKVTGHHKRPFIFQYADSLSNSPFLESEENSYE